MSRLLLLDDTDVQQAFAAHLRSLREGAKLSRAALAERSSVPAPTIKKFELTGQISFRQLLLLWQSLDDLARLHELTQAKESRKGVAFHRGIRHYSYQANTAHLIHNQKHRDTELHCYHTAHESVK